MTTFYEDILKGLSSEQKFLESKYFYDKTGDQLFKKIMDCPEYYLSRCELEILTDQVQQIASSICQTFTKFDLIELGPGDASKSIPLLQALQAKGANFSYIPVDISQNIINSLKTKVPSKLKGIPITGYAGEYLEMLRQVSIHHNSPKVILFLGSSIGNFDPVNALTFCKNIAGLLNPNDLFLIGFDLLKDPATILSAYNDSQGITKEFNLNLLTRINRELQGDFVLDNFEHFPTYDPRTGLCKSYLISKKDQKVTLHLANKTICFSKHEPILMERSMKYTLNETVKLAVQASFTVEHHFFDQKNWFVDSLWKKTSRP